MENARNISEQTTAPITVRSKDLMKMLGVGRTTALKIGKDANAIIRLSGNCTLYDVQKIKEYLEKKRT